MKSKQLRKTSKLIAIDECKMNCDGKPTLTIGKEYKITNINEDSVSLL